MGRYPWGDKKRTMMKQIGFKLWGATCNVHLMGCNLISRKLWGASSGVQPIGVTTSDLDD